jgi:DNA-directed RNA polymerase subunit RPC12/RpoP
MFLEFRCINCDNILRTETRFAGRMSRCPRCHNRLIVPDPKDERVLRLIQEEEPLPTEQELTGLATPVVDTREVLVIGEELILPLDALLRIRTLLQWRIEDTLRTLPLWGISIGVHAVAILLIATLGVFTLSGQKAVRRIIPVQSSSVIAELPQKMQDVNVDRSVAPDFEDILLHEKPSSGSSGKTEDDLAGLGTPGAAPAVIGIEDPLAAMTSGRGVGPIGPGDGMGGGRGVGFFGHEAGGAGSVVFIVDASFSMVDGPPGKTRWDLAVNELRSSVEKLTFGHLLNVYFTRVTPDLTSFYERWKNQPVLADPANKKDCFAFIDRMDDIMQGTATRFRAGTQLSGWGTDVTQAVADALKSTPDVIFILSDAEFGELLQMGQNPASDIRRLNRYHGARIYTVCLKVRSGEKVMRQIAEENRGRFKFIP